MSAKVKMIIGSAMADLKGTMVDELVKAAAAAPNERFFIIVPEQATLQMQKAVVMAHPKGACMNIDVVSFARLALVVFAKLGMDESNVLDDTGKVLVLKRVLEMLKDDLTFYKSKARQIGFIDEVKSIVTEFKQYTVDDNELFLMEEKAHETGDSVLAKKLHEIRLIYRKFNEEIEERFRITEEMLETFARVAKDAKIIRNSHIYLDGFTGFTPIQYKVLESFMECTSDITCTLTLPPEQINESWRDYDLFALSNETYFKLKGKAADRGAFLCEDEIVRSVRPGKAECFTYKAPTISAEVEWTAAEILKLVREDGMRFRDIAVIAGDMGIYYGQVRKIFADAGIPTFIDYKDSINSNPVVRFVMAALKMIAERMSYESVFSFLKTGLAGLDGNEVSLLENYCLEFNIKSWNAWNSAFTRNSRLHGVYDDGRPVQRWDLAVINRLRARAVRSFRKFYEKGIGNKEGAIGYSTLLKELLEDNKVDEKIQRLAANLPKDGRLDLAIEYKQIYKLITDLLDKSGAILAHDAISLKEYAEVLESGLMEMKIGIIPPSMDCLEVGDLTRTRFGAKKVLFVIGAIDGCIPQEAGSGGILTQRERETLMNADFEIAPTAQMNLYEQNFYLHLAFCKPEEKLFITHAALSDEGAELTPSCILRDLDELLPGHDFKEAEPHNGIFWKSQGMKALTEQVRTLVAGYDQTPAADIVDGGLLKTFAESDPDAIRQIIDGALFSTRQTPLDKQTALDLYGDVLTGSVSRYENFADCPYKHFLNYGLRLEKRAEYEVEATDLGTIYHGALELYSKKLEEAGHTFRDISDEESHALAAESVAEAAAGMESDVLESSAHNAFLLKRVEAITVKTTDVLRAHVKMGDFDPKLYEFEFSFNPTENVRFKGKIDRVDIYDGGDLFVKIIDYKSGSKEFSFNDIYAGTQLQLVAYLDQAIRKISENEPGRRVRPAGVYYYLINDKFVDNETDEGKKYQMSGVTLNDPVVFTAIDENLANGSAKSEIIKVSTKKDGQPDSYSLVATSDEFAAMISFVNGKINHIGEAIREGDISVAPYYASNTDNGCRFCDYKDVCKFEDGKWDSEYRDETGIPKEQKKSMILGRECANAEN